MSLFSSPQKDEEDSQELWETGISTSGYGRCLCLKQSLPDGHPALVLEERFQPALEGLGEGESVLGVGTTLNKAISEGGFIHPLTFSLNTLSCFPR